MDSSPFPKNSKLLKIYDECVWYNDVDFLVNNICVNVDLVLFLPSLTHYFIGYLQSKLFTISTT